VCVNPHSLEVARQDQIFLEALQSADLAIPDGVGVVLASRILGGSIKMRITGSDIFWSLNKAMNKPGNYKCFFLGSTEETLIRIRERMAKDFPNVTVAGCCSPPFRYEFTEEENCGMIEAVNRAAPDVLWVGMTAPKQEKWIFLNKDKVNVKFIGAVGGVFDFFSGNIRRNEYPWFLNHGLEWLPRLLGEPRRLWKRMFVSAPLFMARVLAERIKR
jgi:N-acetylglucosaminyldiphosphoundecaprenol N-acetyl-beta-D-mannosaminyltransferase